MCVCVETLTWAISFSSSYLVPCNSAVEGVNLPDDVKQDFVCLSNDMYLVRTVGGKGAAR